MRLRRVEPAVRRALRGPCAPPPNARRATARVLTAVSGGADSTALLLALCRLAREARLEIRAAHLHHGLRGAEADADLEFVRALCARLHVPLVTARWNAPVRLRRRGLTGEDGLRVLRREFLEQAARRTGAHTVATAHTADDQLETLLMRLGRGTGLAGLGGMKPAVRRRDGRGRTLLWIKPMLEVTRAAIEADLRGAAAALPARPGPPGWAPWCEDRTNRDPRHTRNRVRHEAVPALVRALLPDADPVRGRAQLALRATRAAGAVRASAQVLERAAARVLARSARSGPGAAELETAPLARLPGALRSAVLGGLWLRTGPPGTGLTLRHLASLDGLIDSARGGAIIQLPGGWWAERDRDCIRFRQRAARPRPDTRAVTCGAGPRGAHAKRGSGPAAVRLHPPARLRWDGRRIEARWTSGGTARRRLRAAPEPGEYFAADEIREPLVMRRARTDERFIPFGRTRAAQLGRFLSKQGVTNHVRRHPTVLADAGGILWVVGVRRSARAPVTAATRRALWVHAERHD